MMNTLFALLFYSLWMSVRALEQTVCESKLGFVNCPLGQVIQIDSVLYGRTQQSVCNQFNAPISNLNCKSTSVSTNSVTNYCQGRSACLLTADNAQLGEDPCPQVPKYLQVQYRCVTSIQTSLSTPSTTPKTSRTTTTQRTTPLTTRSSTTPHISSTISSSSVTSPTTSSTTIRTTPTSTLSTTSQSSTVSLSPRNSKDVHVCHDYLISGPHGVPDGQLSASSFLSLSQNAHRARLFLEIKKYPNGFMLEGAWTANASDKQPYVEVKLNWLSIIQGVGTQGRHVNPDTRCCREWTTRYLIHYSIDGNSWTTLQENNVNKVFVGNTDTDTIVTHMFDCPFSARYVRIEIKDYYSRPSLRFELIGCPTNTDDLGKCPKGWKERAGSGTCYYISDQSELKSWENAELMCKRHQGNMVKIDSVRERDWLIAELKKLQQAQQLDRWWIGLNNRPRFDNNYYKWHDGTQLDTNVINWLPSEPSNAGGIEHCAEYSISRAGLNDRNCDTARPFICELSKFWKSPVNIPGVNTVKPTLPTTLAPTTVPNLVPTPVTGGNIVTAGQTVFYTGCSNVTDCARKRWGDYPSCTGCHFYLTCAPSGVFVRACPQNLKYDDNIQACTAISSTCRGP